MLLPWFLTTFFQDRNRGRLLLMGKLNHRKVKWKMLKVTGWGKGRSGIWIQISPSKPRLLRRWHLSWIASKGTFVPERGAGWFWKQRSGDLTAHHTWGRIRGQVCWKQARYLEAWRHSARTLDATHCRCLEYSADLGLDPVITRDALRWHLRDQD